MDETLKDIIFGGLQKIADEFYLTNYDWEVITPECKYLRNTKTGVVIELEAVEEEEHLFI